MNNNFDYLDGRITTVGSSITTIQSNIQSLNSTLSNQINQIQTDMENSTVSKTENNTISGNNTFSGTNGFTGNVTISGSSFNFTKCTTKPTTTSTASTSKVSVIVKNYLNGNSGYVKYSDGLIIQWGQNTTASQDAKISLLTNFATTTYFVALQLVNKRSGSQQNIAPYDKSTSSFYRTCNGGTEYNNPIAWIAIGY